MCRYMCFQTEREVLCWSLVATNGIPRARLAIRARKPEVRKELRKLSPATGVIWDLRAQSGKKRITVI